MLIDWSGLYSFVFESVSWHYDRLKCILSIDMNTPMTEHFVFVLDASSVALRKE